MTYRTAHFTEVDSLTCGWASMKAARSRSRSREHTLRRTSAGLLGWVTNRILPKVRSEELTAIAQRFCKEVVMWKNLRHPNVLPLLGVTMSYGHFAIVSEWMTNGNINEFVKAHEGASWFEPVG